MKNREALTPGARVLIRDEEWLIRRVDSTTSGNLALHVVGLSALVAGVEKIFLDYLDDIIVVDPKQTEFVLDNSENYRKSRLHIESLLRQTPPTDDVLYIGYKGAMDLNPYQLDPAIKALHEPRCRIMIADTTGLGKTIECGILLSELIKRGRGKRILVLTVKSMMTQFQKELWSRFTIPLVRLDSVGIQRVRHHIPTNHNPLYYYDRIIISIDTLKQESEYQDFLRNSYWDIIVIDEAQNVAERALHSQRSRLAKLVASRSDSLIMLSATPHDGRSSSFASLMNMLNPTAIADPENFSKEEINGLFIRRFKKDIKAQVKDKIQERIIQQVSVEASDWEEIAYDIFASREFPDFDQRNPSSIMLAGFSLEKGLFSSASACLESIQNRLKVLKGRNNPEDRAEQAWLEQLKEALSNLPLLETSKYVQLLNLLRPKTGTMKWDPSNTRDRVVIFTERIATMNFLVDNLRRDLQLEEEQIKSLDGSMPDTDIMKIVEDFGNESSKIRLLVCSDVASEGINLHYLSHRMIHYDIPWSLMVFQQRNGRIDRYGQTERPEIYYLCMKSKNEKIWGDQRVLERLIIKDEVVHNNIGDPTEFTHIYSPEEEERDTFSKMRHPESEPDTDDPLADLLNFSGFSIGNDKVDEAESLKSQRTMPTIFSSDYEYAKEALIHIKAEVSKEIEFECNDAKKYISIEPTEDIKNRLRRLPPEIIPETGDILLVSDPKWVMQAIRRSRESEKSWSAVQLLWEQHPLLVSINDTVLASFRRQEAPVIELDSRELPSGDYVFLVYAVISNQKSQPVLYSWYGVHYHEEKFVGIIPFTECIERFSLKRSDRPNPKYPIDKQLLRNLLADALSQIKDKIKSEKDAWARRIAPRLDRYLDELIKLQEKHKAKLDKDYQGWQGKLAEYKKKQSESEIDKIFDEYTKWVEQTMTAGDTPYIHVVAVLRGGC